MMTYGPARHTPESPSRFPWPKATTPAPPDNPGPVANTRMLLDVLSGMEGEAYGLVSSMHHLGNAMERGVIRQQAISFGQRMAAKEKAPVGAGGTKGAHAYEADPCQAANEKWLRELLGGMDLVEGAHRTLNKTKAWAERRVEEMAGKVDGFVKDTETLHQHLAEEKARCEQLETANGSLVACAKRVAADLNAAMDSGNRLAAQLEGARADNGRLLRQVGILGDEKESMAAKLEGLEDGIKAEKERLGRLVSQKDAELAALRAAAARQPEGSDIKVLLLEQRLEGADGALQQKDEQIAALKARCEQLETANGSLAACAQRVAADLNAAMDSCNRLAAQVEGARADNERLLWQIGILGDEKESMAAKLEGLEDGIKAEKERLGRLVSQKDAELAALRAAAARQSEGSDWRALLLVRRLEGADGALQQKDETIAALQAALARTEAQADARASLTAIAHKAEAAIVEKRLTEMRGRLAARHAARVLELKLEFVRLREVAGGLEARLVGLARGGPGGSSEAHGGILEGLPATLDNTVANQQQQPKVQLRSKERSVAKGNPRAKALLPGGAASFLLGLPRWTQALSSNKGTAAARSGAASAGASAASAASLAAAPSPADAVAVITVSGCSRGGPAGAGKGAGRGRPGLPVTLLTDGGAPDQQAAGPPASGAASGAPMAGGRAKGAGGRGGAAPVGCLPLLSVFSRRGCGGCAAV